MLVDYDKYCSRKFIIPIIIIVSSDRTIFLVIDSTNGGIGNATQVATVTRSGIMIITKRIFLLLFGFLTYSSTAKLYRGRIPRLTSDNCKCPAHETGRGDHDFGLFRSHYTDIDPTSWERGSNPRPPHQESRALPNELPPPPLPSKRDYT